MDFAPRVVKHWLNAQSEEARALYASLGFTPCAPYYDNTCVGGDCFELKLDLTAHTRR